MLEHIRENDEIYCHDISRLARNIEDLHRLVHEITEKGCSVYFVKENLHFTGDTNNPTQQLLLTMLGAVYQFERSILLERQKEGIAIAKAKGKYKGRPPKIDNTEIVRVLREGNSISKTAEILGVSMSSVQRAKKTMNYRTYDELIALIAEFRLKHKDLSDEARNKLIRKQFKIDRATLRELDGVGDLISFPST